MTVIGVVIHGPKVIDSGRAEKVLEKLSNLGSITAVLGGTMGRAAVIDAELENLIDISRSLKPSESILNMCSVSDTVLLVNEGKSTETGLAFGRLVYEKLGSIDRPLFQLEFGGMEDNGCLLVPWSGKSHPCFPKLEDLLKASVIQRPPADTNIQIRGHIVKRRITGVRPGEYVTVNGIVIGKALSDEVCIISESREITGLEGGRLKPHGVEKLKDIDLASAIVRSGPLRTANVTPRVLKCSGSGYAVIVDHSAEDIFELAGDADLAVVVGDDTTAVAGDLLTRLGIPMIGITDGDRDGITHYTHVPPGSVIVRLAPGNDDVIGRRVREEMFSNGRMEIGDAGFDGILAGVIEIAGRLVEEVERY